MGASAYFPASVVLSPFHPGDMFESLAICTVMLGSHRQARILARGTKQGEFKNDSSKWIP